MISYALRRLLFALPIALGVSLVVFSLVHIAPGDPISAILPNEASETMVADARREFGLDKPLAVQYAIWLGRTLRGDLGSSIGTGQPVLAEVLSALKHSAILTAAAGLLACVFGVILGLLSASARRSRLTHLVNLVNITGVSIPHYWLAILLVIVFSVHLGWLPPLGMAPDTSNGWRPDWDHLQFLLLPALATAAIPAAIIARTLAASIQDITERDFITTLRAKGLRRGRIHGHVLRNALPTALAAIGLQVGNMLGGSVLVETVFSWPGTGFLLSNAIFQRDLPLLQGTMLVLSLIFVLINLAVDLMQCWLDPRIGRG